MTKVAPSIEKNKLAGKVAAKHRRIEFFAKNIRFPLVPCLLLFCLSSEKQLNLHLLQQRFIFYLANISILNSGANPCLLSASICNERDTNPFCQQKHPQDFLLGSLARPEWKRNTKSRSLCHKSLSLITESLISYHIF